MSAVAFARDEVAQRLAAILRESEAAQRKLDDARSETVARAAETETHVVARDMARIELQELQQKIHETEQRLSQLQATLAEVGRYRWAGDGGAGSRWGGGRTGGAAT